MEAKKRLAGEVVKLYHGQAAADEARAGFEKVFQQHALPEEIPTILLKDDAPRSILDLLIQTGLAPSRKQARQLVDGGGVSVDGAKVTDIAAQIIPTPGMVVKRGSRNFVKLHIAAEQPEAIRAALQQAIEHQHKVFINYNHNPDGTRAGVSLNGEAICPIEIKPAPHGEMVWVARPTTKSYNLSGITRVVSTGDVAGLVEVQKAPSGGWGRILTSRQANSKHSGGCVLTTNLTGAARFLPQTPAGGLD